MLFEHATIGLLRVKNRVIRSATAEMMANEVGRPLPALGSLYRALARGGVGLIVTGHLFVHRSGKAHRAMTGIDSDEGTADLKYLARAVHEHGGAIAAQINHAGRHAMTGDPMAPTALPADERRPAARAIGRCEIERIVSWYAAAARRARDAGFDAVQIHAAHGYLVSQFLSPLTNRRTDEWGGTPANRSRFLLEVVSAVRKVVGPDYPVLVKLGMRDEADDGLTLEEGVEIVRRLQERVELVELSGGVASTSTFNIATGVEPGKNEAYFRPWAQAVKAAGIDVPIALVGGLRSRVVMDDVLASGDAQFVSLCRPLICEPDLPERMRRGQTESSICVSRNRCWPRRGETGISCSCLDLPVNGQS